MYVINFCVMVGAVVLSINPSTHVEDPAVIFNLYVFMILFWTTQ